MRIICSMTHPARCSDQRGRTEAATMFWQGNSSPDRLSSVSLQWQRVQHLSTVSPVPDAVVSLAGSTHTRDTVIQINCLQSWRHYWKNINMTSVIVLRHTSVSGICRLDIRSVLKKSGHMNTWHTKIIVFYTWRVENLKFSNDVFVTLRIILNLRVMRLRLLSL